ncbi:MULTISPECIES: LysR family transcriptional regulator [Dyella]|uniref:LysR family transcriptional regulator n=2 Tax=Dyella TaxID=231454 RepID=A0A4R0YVX5_9GAMM|nr:MULTISPECIES: LysR family transcriptional regulator [Dyella]TBR38886.1 LysR family transcriptional regulator [Dyella terrae]TCI13522.1 LysR family transcriptional regulator [Dyella soli]
MTRELPPLNALRAFEVAARLESLSRAADVLHVTHGAVSRQIRSLEVALGKPLFARQGRGLVLTPAGRELLQLSNETFERLRDGWQTLQRGGSDAPFVLGCPGSLLARWVIPRMDALQDGLPGLKLHMAAQDSPFLAALPGLDAALMLASPPWPSEWRAYPLAKERIGPVVSPRFADLKTLVDGGVNALRHMPVLHTSSRPQAWPDWAQSAGIEPGAIPMGRAFDHLYYLLEAAVAGLGVAIAPAQLVAEDLSSGRLIAPWGFRETGGWWVLAAPARVRDERVTQLAAWLERALTAEDTDVRALREPPR